jgi:hypothetical protein
MDFDTQFTAKNSMDWSWLSLVAHLISDSKPDAYTFRTKQRGKGGGFPVQATQYTSMIAV